MPRLTLPHVLLLAVLGFACGGGSDARSVAGTVVTDADLALAEGLAARAALVDELLLLRHAKDTGMGRFPSREFSLDPPGVLSGFNGRMLLRQGIVRLLRPLSA